MNKALSLGLCLSLALGGVAQATPSTHHHGGGKKPTPAPTPTPTPTPDAAGGEPTADTKPSPAPTGPGTPDPDTGNKGLGGNTVQQPTDRPWAVGVTDSQRTQALALFRDGNVQLQDGIFLVAADKYRQALTHWEHPAIYYNLALALMNMDQPVDVYEALIKATKYGAAPLENDKYERAKNYLLLAEKQIATVTVSAEQPGAKVSLDGKLLFTAPGKYTGFVRTGKHNFVAEKQGANARLEAPFIEGGDKFRIALRVYTPEELTRYRRPWKKTWIPWAVVGSGFLIAGIGYTFELSAKSGYKDFDAAVTKCGNAGCDFTPALTSIRTSADTKQTTSYVGYGMGAAAVLTGLVLAWVNRSQPYQIRPEDAEKDQGTLSFKPIISPGMTGGMAEAHF
jgi:hypothetical protein